MKTKILIVLTLAASMWLVGCRGDANANMKANNGNMAVMSPTPVMKTNEMATDPMMKGKVEAALKAKGFNDVTVDTTTTPKATLRGTVAKGKMTEAVQVAQEAAGKPFDNQLAEK